MSEQRNAIFSELGEYRKECHEEIEGHYKKTGRGPWNYQGYGGYEHPGCFDHVNHPGGWPRGYPQVFEKLESYNPKVKDTKFLDEMPEESPAALEVEGYLDRNKGR